MNHDKLVHRGHLPWSPNSAATDLDVWFEYEIPLVGTFRLEEQVVLFSIVGDPSQDFTVWAYRCLSSAEAAAAADIAFESHDELSAYVRDLFAHRLAVFALARDLQVGEWMPIEVERDLLSAAVEFLKSVVKAIAPDPLAALRGAVAEVETLNPDLINV